MNVFRKSNYQLDEEVLQSARQKVMESRQNPNSPSINYVISEMDILREDIQEILKRLNPSRKPGKG